MDTTSKALLALVALGAGALLIDVAMDAREPSPAMQPSARAPAAAPIKPMLSAEQERAESDRRMLEEEAAEFVRMAQAERTAKIGNKPVPSVWDGSYPEIERYLKQIAHDPDSIDFESCGPPVITEAGWNIRCIYRGKNAFGALVRNDNFFLVAHGRVVAVK